MQLFRACVLSLAVLLAAPVSATLPAVVDGQPLPSLAPMLERVTPAVVNINSSQRVRVRNPFFDDPFFRRFFDVPDVPQERVDRSLGSGVIVDASRGLVLTNSHVVNGADEISVTLHDGRTLKAELVGADPATDVAVIRVPAERLTALALADSDRLRVGDFVVAIGNPFGLGQTVTSGIVSALGRSGIGGLGYQNFIQTDASINPGNSGGALVNLRGELVGINTAILSPSGGNVGIGFAIPASLSRTIMEQLLANGEVLRGNLGVRAQDLDARLKRALGLPEALRGALVTQVVPDSPAEAAGVRSGDVITEIGGRPVTSAADLANSEGLLPLNQRLDLKLMREGKPLTRPFTLTASRQQRTAAGRIDARLEGATLGELSTEQRRGGLQGVLVLGVDAGTRAAQLGFQAGDVISAVNRRRVGNLADLTALLEGGPAVVLTITRGGRGYVLQLP
ncbi:MAG: Do family serine endopeptidase [Xanthomonadales bacterium]|nr:Do family serine endopeptidase [Xanthomonadales bacterium]